MRTTSHRFFLLIFAILGFGTGATSATEALVSKEYQVKAAFLYNFLQFVEWPDTAFPDAQAPLGIGVLGENPFGNVLDEIVAGEIIRNRTVVVRRTFDIEALNHCNVIFISASEAARLEEIMPRLQAKAILTVSEIERFTERGGTIRFYLEGKKVRFEINPAIAHAHGMKMSSQLLSLGTVVEAK